MRKSAVIIFAFVLCISLVGCAQTESIDFPFELSEVENVEMFHFIDPTDAEKKVITKQKDIEDTYKLLESVSLEDTETEPVAGGAATCFRFNLSDGTTYEIVYSSIAVKSGRIMLSNNEKDYFTLADIEAIWNDCNYEMEEAAESELPTTTSTEENTENEVVAFHGQLFNKSVLSKETLAWLEWYNSLLPEEQLAVSSIPADLYTDDGAGTVDSDAEE